MERTELSIEGMSCGHCVQAVERALEEVEGVQIEEVEIGRARIRYEAGRVSAEQVRTAIEDEGYTVQSTGELR